MASLAFITLTGMVATFPPAVVAAYGLGNRLISLVFLPAMGLGQATNTIVGQNLGADRPDRAERAVWIAAKLAVGVLSVVAILVWAFPTTILTPMMSADTAQAAETLRYGSEYLRVVALAFVFMGLFPVFLGAFRGAGNTTTALVFSAVALWLARVPVTYYLVFELGWGTTGIWTAVAIGDVVGAIAAIVYFTRGTWKGTIVDRNVETVADGGQDDVTD
jgi:Na+-driven multidrug efflux pump